MPGNFQVLPGLFDRYIMDTCRKNAPRLARNLEQNQGTNLTNRRFCAQANGARHEEINKNLFRGETTKVFRKSFTLVNDICAMRANMLDHSGMKERYSGDKVRDYEPIISKIRIGLRRSDNSDSSNHIAPQSLESHVGGLRCVGSTLYQYVCDMAYYTQNSSCHTVLRKSEYLGAPMKEKELSSMNGEPLNPALCDLLKRSMKARDSDITCVIRYLDIKKVITR